MALKTRSDVWSQSFKDRDQGYSTQPHAFWRNLCKFSLDPFETVVLLYLNDRVDGAYTCFPGIGLIASETGISKTKVKQVIKTLKSRGFIGVTQKPTSSGGYPHNVYSLAPLSAALEEMLQPSGALENGPEASPGADIGDGDQEDEPPPTPYPSILSDPLMQEELLRAVEALPSVPTDSYFGTLSKPEQVWELRSLRYFVTRVCRATYGRTAPKLTDKKLLAMASEYYAAHRAAVMDLPPGHRQQMVAHGVGEMLFPSLAISAAASEAPTPC